MWLKYSRNIRVIERSRATGWIPNSLSPCRLYRPQLLSGYNKCLIYTLDQFDQPRMLLIEFSVLSIDLDFLQRIVHDSIL